MSIITSDNKLTESWDDLYNSLGIVPWLRQWLIYLVQMSDSNTKHKSKLVRAVFQLYTIVIRIATVPVKCTLWSYTTDVSENLFRSHISERSEVKYVCIKTWSIAQTCAKDH